MQKNSWQILSTRPLDKAIIQKAAQQHIQLDCISFIQTEAIKDEKIERRIKELSEQRIVAVFTSMNAVEAVNEYLPAKKPGWEIYCIGHATQQLVKNIFGESQIKATADDASKLADTIINNNEKKVVFFCGDQRREELPKKLKEHDTALEEIVVYKTLSLKEKVAKTYDGILFYSPSAVHSFFSVNKTSGQTICFAIGQTTANAIREYSNNQLIIANKPGKEALVNQAITYFATTQQPIRH